MQSNHVLKNKGMPECFANQVYLLCISAMYTSCMGLDGTSCHIPHTQNAGRWLAILLSTQDHAFNYNYSLIPRTLHGGKGLGTRLAFTVIVIIL